MNAKIVLVFSDSHGRVDEMVRIAKKEKPDMIFHLGDYAADARKIEKQTGIITHAVKGNCDCFDTEDDIKEIFVSGHKIVLTHGDKYGVRYSYDRLSYLGEEREATAVLFGHTHIKFLEYTGSLWLINPGSISSPRDGMPSYAKLMIGSYGVVPKLINA